MDTLETPSRIFPQSLKKPFNLNSPDKVILTVVFFENK